MSDTNVKQLAQVLGLSVEKLLEQLAEAGIKKTGDEEIVSSTEKMKLLGSLRKQHGKTDAPNEDQTAPRQITLQRKKVSKLTVTSGTTKGKTVNVEVRQKRTYVKRTSVPEASTEISTEREEALRLLQASEAQRAAQEVSLREADEKRRQFEQDTLLKKQHKIEEKTKLESPIEQDPMVLDMPVYDEKTPKQTVSTNAKTATKTADKKAEVQSVASKQVGKATAIIKDDNEAKARKDIKPREATKDKDSRVRGARDDVPRRHKPVHGSHQMQDDEFADDPQVGRYIQGELHLAALGLAARRPGGRRKPKNRHHEENTAAQHGFSKPTAPVIREVAIGETIVVAELAQKLAVKGAEIVKALFKMGVMVTINQVIDHDTAALVVEELGHHAIRATDKDAETTLIASRVDHGEMSTRPPVVTIMGHVDHGKTSLLDYIRRTKVASGEAGGITQHIGAYHVEVDKGVITFLDTPGHSAFTSMRARGAKLTDIVILVVAADDGVMPQTVEAIQHARAANVPIIVAVNKIDKPGAQPERVKQGLIQHEVVPEEFGGDIMFVPVSAKTGEGIDNLLDAILVQSEVLELRAVQSGEAAGTVIESSLDKGRGPVATVLIQQGILCKGDFLVCGLEYGRIRALFNEVGQQIESAGPSIPVQLLGLSGVPEAGDDFVVVRDERLAKDVAQQRQAKRRETRLVKQVTTMEDLMAQIGQTNEQQTLNIVVKADVQGSAEALREALTNISNADIKINVMAAGVGGINESDATLASASQAVLIGFNVRADATARKIIDSSGINLRYFSIIYDVIDQVKQVASGLLSKEVRENIIGVAQVRDVFRSSKFGAIAGCMVTEGIVKRNKPIRVLRDNVVVFQGELESLRRFKEAVEEVRNNMECGIGVKQYNDIKEGDQIECFERIEIARTL